MSRPERYCPAGVPQHVVQRGINRQICFVDDVDKKSFLKLLSQYASKHQVQIHAYVLMSNHVHLLATPVKEGALTKMMQCIGTVYVREFNKRHQRTGSLWEGRFRASLVDKPRYLLLCYRYIELNPVRAHMVSSPENYPWSSYHFNALGKPSGLITPHPEYQNLANANTSLLEAYRALFPSDHQLLDEQVSLLRYAINKGKPVGSLAS